MHLQNITINQVKKVKHEKDIVQRGIELRNHLKKHDDKWEDEEESPFEGKKKRYVKANFENSEKAINWLNRYAIERIEIIKFEYAHGISDAKILLYTNKEIILKTKEDIKEEKKEFWISTLIISGTILFVITGLVIYEIFWCTR